MNYLGWAGVLEDTAPGLPPVQVADLAAGALGAVTEVLAALRERDRTGVGGQRIVVSMTHAPTTSSHIDSDGDPVPRMLTGGLACYRIYATADERFLTVGALEPKFFRRLCELVGAPDLADGQYDEDQDGLADELAAIFVTGDRLPTGSRTSGTRMCASGPSRHEPRLPWTLVEAYPRSRCRSEPTREPGGKSSGSDP